VPAPGTGATLEREADGRAGAGELRAVAVDPERDVALGLPDERRGRMRSAEGVRQEAASRCRLRLLLAGELSQEQQGGEARGRRGDEHEAGQAKASESHRTLAESPQPIDARQTRLSFARMPAR
jgi:hypothetical protein